MHCRHSSFADVKKSVTTINNLSSNLKRMSNWAFQWVLTLTFRNKHKRVSLAKRPSRLAILKYFLIVFHSQKHLGLIIGSKLTLDIRIKSAMAKVNNAIDPVRNLQYAVSRPSLVTIYKAFTRSHLDYGDIVFD